MSGRQRTLEFAFFSNHFDEMTLTDISDIFSIIASVATVFIALWVFLWTQRSEKNNQRRHSNNEMQTFNLAVLQDDNLLQIEADRHPFGEIGLDGARKMYQHFLWLNITDNIRKASKNGLLDKAVAEARFANQALLTYPDRDFLEKHVFPRGYETDFIEAFRKRWNVIENQ